jgi:hypothetical protein
MEYRHSDALASSHKEGAAKGPLFVEAESLGYALLRSRSVA